MLFNPSKSRFATAAVLALSLSTTGCGLISSLTDFFPTLSFSVPDSLYTSDARIGVAPHAGTRTKTGEGSGTEPNPSGPLGMMADRMQRSVDDVNLIFERLNSDGVTGEGTFSGKGPEGTISGKVTALTDDPDYAYEAVICVSGTAFQQVKWNEDKTKVQVIRDFMKTPVPGGNDAPEGTSFIGKVTYDASDADAVSTVLQVTGTPWHTPGDITDTSLVAYEKGIADADGNLILTGVNDWYSDTFPATPAGQSYIVGTLSADGTTGSSLGYREESAECDGVTFDESAPSWCLGMDMGAATPYSTDEEFSTAWTALQAAGAEITPQASLEEITLPSDLSCE